MPLLLGPLIRVLGEKFGSGVKAAVLNALLSLIEKVHMLTFDDR